MTTYKFLIIEDDDSDFSRLKQLLCESYFHHGKMGRQAKVLYSSVSTHFLVYPLSASFSFLTTFPNSSSSVLLVK